MQDKIEGIKLFGLALSTMFLGIMFGMRSPGIYTYEIGVNMVEILAFGLFLVIPALVVNSYFNYKVKMRGKSQWN